MTLAGRVSLDDALAFGINLAHPDGVWESALLVHDEPASATFAHRTVAEFLAARYLTDFGYKVQRRLLADPNDREVVTPQLAGVAQWLSYSSPGVFKPESTDGEGAADMEIWWKCLLICGDSYW